jgi:hypothetical protein
MHVRLHLVRISRYVEREALHAAQIENVAVENLPRSNVLTSWPLEELATHE